MAEPPFFVEPLPFTVVSASSGPANRPASHLAEFSFVGMVWQSNAATEHYLELDFGKPVTIDQVSLLNTNAQLGTRWYIAMGTSTVQASSGSAPFTTFPAEPVINPPSSGRDYYHGLLTFTPQTYRYMTIRVIDHSGTFEASMLVAGKRVTPQKYYEPEWESGPEDLGNLAFGRNGIPDISTGVVLRRIGFTLAWMTEQEHELTFSPMLRRLGRRNPVLLCFDPSLSLYRQDRTYFGTMPDQSRTRKLGQNRFEKRFEIASVI